MVVRWRIDDVILERNPDVCNPRYDKKVEYQEVLDGPPVRINPSSPGGLVTSIEVGFKAVDEDFRNLLHDKFVRDEEFWIYTNLSGSKRDTWRVKIDQWQPSWRLSGENQRFDLSFTLRVVGLESDVERVETFSPASSPWPFSIEAQGNSMALPIVFVRGKNVSGVLTQDVMITNRGKNLLPNSSFEDHTPTEIASWTSEGCFEVDYVYAATMAGLVGTSMPVSARFSATTATNTSLTSEAIYVKPNTPYVLSGFVMMAQGFGGSAVFRWEEYRADGTPIASGTASAAPPANTWERPYTSFLTHSDAAYVKVKCLVQSGVGRAYFDQLQLEEASSTTSPPTAHEDSVVASFTYKGALSDSDLLVVDLRIMTAYKNHPDNYVPINPTGPVDGFLHGYILGDRMRFYPGRSHMEFSDAVASNHQAEITFKYREVWR